MMDLRSDAAAVLSVAFVMSIAYEWYRATAKAGVSRHDTLRGFVQQLPLYVVAGVVVALLLLGPTWSAWVGLVFVVGMIAVSIGYYNPVIMLERRPGIVDWIEDLVFTGALFVAATQLWYTVVR